MLIIGYFDLVVFAVDLVVCRTVSQYFAQDLVTCVLMFHTEPIERESQELYIKTNCQNLNYCKIFLWCLPGHPNTDMLHDLRFELTVSVCVHAENRTSVCACVRACVPLCVWVCACAHVHACSLAHTLFCAHVCICVQESEKVNKSHNSHS